jgi:hypothetical protein
VSYGPAGIASGSRHGTRGSVLNFAGMAELADALDSKSVCPFFANFLCFLHLHHFSSAKYLF